MEEWRRLKEEREFREWQRTGKVGWRFPNPTIWDRVKAHLPFIVGIIIILLLVYASIDSEPVERCLPLRC